jgi:hypothetical protein
MNAVNPFWFLARMPKMYRVSVVLCVAALMLVPFYAVSPDKALDETGAGALQQGAGCKTDAVLQWGNGTRDIGLRFMLSSSVSGPEWNRIWTGSRVRVLPLENGSRPSSSRPLRFLQQSLLL